MDTQLGFVMNDQFFSRRGIAMAVVVALILAVCAGPILAASTFVDNSQATICFAGYFQDVAGNRSKIIQLSIVFVLIGIALLFKK